MIREKRSKGDDELKRAKHESKTSDFSSERRFYDMRWFIIENEFGLWEVYDLDGNWLCSLTHDELITSYYNQCGLMEARPNEIYLMPENICYRALYINKSFIVEEGAISW